VEKLDRLRQAIGEKRRLLVLFSGGLDSTVLAKVAHDVLKEEACALTFDSPIIPSGDLAEARSLAALIGIRHVAIHMDELSEPGFAMNPPDRCYLCRKSRDAKAIAWAHDNGFMAVADGLNASDLSDYRPGMKAAREDHIWQPFADLGVTKDELRVWAREMGLPIWDKPNTVCLCSRFPYGFPLEADLLRRVEEAEAFLKRFGFKQVRVRYFPYDTALIEVDDLDAVLHYKEDIRKHLRSLGFSFITLDLEGFASGKLNRLLD
jgi:uncharacterized protein